MTSVQSVGRVWSAAAAVATGVAVTLGLPLQLRGRRLAALLAEPAVVLGDRAASGIAGRNSCLYRAALRCLLLRRAGAPAVLRIGARPRETGAVAAHAWVELLGEPIPEEARPFTVLQRASASA